MARVQGKSEELQLKRKPGGPKYNVTRAFNRETSATPAMGSTFTLSSANVSGSQIAHTTWAHLNEGRGGGDRVWRGGTGARMSMPGAGDVRVVVVVLLVGGVGGVG